MPEGTVEDVDRAARAAAAALPGWSATSLRRPREGLHRHRRGAEGAGAGGRAGGVDRDGRAVADRRHGAGRAAGHRLRLDGGPRRRGRVGAAVGQLAARPPAGRRRRLPSRRGTTRCTRSRRRSRRRSSPAARSCSSRPSSCPGVAYLLAEVIDAVGLPAGRLQPGARHRAGRRRGDREAPAGRHGVVHRLDPGRPARGRAGRRGAQAHVARARRQERVGAARRPVRRGAGERGRRLADRLPHQLRADLQRAHPAARAARPARRGEGLLEVFAQFAPGRRPAVARPPSRARSCQQGPAGARPGVHPRGASTRARRLVAGGPGAAGRPADRLLRAADGAGRRGRRRRSSRRRSSDRS